MSNNPQTDFDGCYRKCRIERRHTMEYGGCEHADKPEPTVSMSKVYTDSDGYPSIGYDQYTVPQLARLIEGAVGDALRAAAAARAIVHRNDAPAVLPAVPVPPATHATERATQRDRIAEAALSAVEAALGDTLLPGAREEALAGIAAVLPPPADHGYCQSMTGIQGSKRGGTCKFCEAPCICTCHEKTARPTTPGDTP